MTGIGNVIFHSVPKGKRWTMTFMRASRASGTMTYNAFLEQDAEGLSNSMEIFTSEANVHLKEFQQPVQLDENWDVIVFFDVHSVTGNVTVVITYEEEAAF